jgi:hypothetical protein
MKVRIVQVSANRPAAILSGWMDLHSAQMQMGEWSTFTNDHYTLVIRNRFGKQIGLGLKGKASDMWG